MIGKKNSLLVEENNNWNTIRVSDVTVENIVALIKTLKQDLSENFFIAFKSLEKLGKKAQKLLQSEIKRLEKGDWKIKIFKHLIFHSNISDSFHPLISQLYSPDFIQRARAVMIASECSWGSDFFDYILPLLDDPDDSVRWAVLNYLSQKNNNFKKIAFEILKRRYKLEKNKIIKKKIGELTK
ncbi:MAG: HEAT repeat domain-containing protein [Candidatus Lokiarchaeota archaeon]|nr:HEAT repeat domain-containing protein [Candidatus Lokiarchaeota archaeon]